MDKLEKGKQAEVRKMSDVRLISKLVQAVFRSDELEAMDRETQLSRYAEVVKSTSTAKPIADEARDAERRKIAR